MKPPLVTIHSPGSISSPPRSPRLHGLLLALKDVIGEDPDDEYDPMSGTTCVDEPLSGSDTSADPAVFIINHSLYTRAEDEQITVESSGSFSTEAQDPLPDDDDDDETLRLPSRSDELETKPSIYTIESSPEAERPPVHPQPTFDLLSPVDLSHLYLGPFVQGGAEPTANERDSIDSGYADTWKLPLPATRSPPHSPLKSTFGVLSSPFATATSRVLSPRLSAFISRPPQSPFAPSAVVDDDIPSDLSLDSPAGDAATETEEAAPSGEYVIVEEEQCYVVAEEGLEDTHKLTEEGNEGEAEDEDNGHDDEYDTGGNTSASSWDDHSNPTAVFLGMPQVTSEEVNIAIQQASNTPTHFLTDVVDFNDDEAITSSSIDIATADDSFTSGSMNPPSLVEEDFGIGDESMDYTAQLAYLASPTTVANENDTLQCLYDQYSDFQEEAQENSDGRIITAAVTPPPEDPPPDVVDIASLSATTPVSSGFIRKRVFTPPPAMVRGRAGTITAPTDSPRSVRSPSASSRALSRRRASPHSQSARSAWSPNSVVSEVGEAIVSKKVPFGFRNSVASGRATTSTLVSNRSSRRNSRAVVPAAVTTSHSNRISSSGKSSPASPVAGGLRPLRLSTVLSAQPASAPSRNSTFSVNRYRQSGISHRASISSISVLSDSSYSRNPLLLSTRASTIPEHIRNTRFSPDNPTPSPLSSHHLRRLATFESPQSAPLTRPSSWYSNPADVDDSTQTTYQHDRPFSRASEPSFSHEEDEEEQEDNYDHTIRRPLPTVPHSAPINRPGSVVRPPMYAIATPKPTLMFAIASDDIKQVRRVLESGDAGPNDAVGPQSALAFALTNDQLTNKMEIVKTLLAFGADPKSVVQQSSSPRNKETVSAEDRGGASPPTPSLMEAMDPATRYYVERADAAHTRRTSALIHRSFFRPLTRVRYELIGQDRALEQLFKDLSMHSRQLSVTPIVVLLCGPSGHGKSLLARKFGSLLDVPTHTVDMTAIHSAQDLWKSYSMSPYDPPSTRSLAEFLIDNEGKRCVVVLDEIEKTHGESPLWALLMPWEHGRCTFEAHGRLVDVRNVVWLGTSNIGQDLVFEHHSARVLPDELMSREEYIELMGLLRPRVSERLGASMLSRVTTALPFVPFTPEERRAICYEALHTIAGDIVRTLSTDVVDGMVKGALSNYTAAEGARSLYRAVSNQLVDNI